MSEQQKLVRCFGCGGLAPDMEGATHRYMLSTPGCWAVYGELLAKSYGEFHFPPVHQVIVDAYAVQHPGEKNSQAIHSVALHLIRLYRVFESGWDIQQASEIMLNATRYKDVYGWLEPPRFMGEITAVDVIKAVTVEDFQKLGTEWGLHAWKAWQKHHPTIRKWAML